jgi:hypothetical protein
MHHVENARPLWVFDSLFSKIREKQSKVFVERIYSAKGAASKRERERSEPVVSNVVRAKQSEHTARDAGKTKNHTTN